MKIRDKLVKLNGRCTPSVNLALPPVGWHRILEQEPQRTTVWACENTVVIAKHPKVES